MRFSFMSLCIVVLLVFLVSASNVLGGLILRYSVFFGYEYHGFPPGSSGYFIPDSYLYVPGKHLLFIVLHPLEVLVTQLGCLYVYSTDLGVDRCLSFLHASPIQAYVYDDKLFVVAGVYSENEPGPVLYTMKGFAVYMISLRDCRILDKHYVYIKDTGMVVPYKEIVDLGDNSFLIPIASLGTGEGFYNRLYRVRVHGDSFDIEEVFSVESEYHDYTKPILTNEYILWGPYIISRNNYELISDLRGGANVTHMSLLINNTYIFTRYYDYKNYYAREAVYYDVKNRMIMGHTILYNKSKDRYEYALIDYGVFNNNRILYIVSKTINGLDIFGANSIAVYDYDIWSNKTFYIGNYTAKEYYFGKYLGYELVILDGAGKLLIIDPESAKSYIVKNKFFREEMGSEYGLGDLIVYHDPGSHRYYLIAIPLGGYGFYKIWLEEEELSPLPEPPVTTLILLAAITILLLKKHRRI